MFATYLDGNSAAYSKKGLCTPVRVLQMVYTSLVLSHPFFKTADRTLQGCLYECFLIQDLSMKLSMKNGNSLS